MMRRTVGAAITAAANEGDAGFTVDMLAGASDIDASDVLSVTNVTGPNGGGDCFWVRP